MGAKNCPETPRQQMIGMMYLVLTAMLALNVSKDILEAFNVVDESLALSNISVKESMQQQYAALYNSDDPKAADAQTKAKQLQKLTDDMVYYIENLRFELVKYVDGDNADGVKEAQELAKKNGQKVPFVPVEKIDGKDNFDKPTHFFLADSEGKNPDTRAYQLKEKLKNYRAAILKLVSEQNRSKVDKRIAIQADCFRHLHHGILPMLSGLKARGIRIGLITNCFSQEAKLIRESKLYPYFDAPCLSWEEGVRKPDPAIYRTCLRRLGIAPENCLYVGDGGSFELETARSLGLQAVQATWYRQPTFEHKQAALRTNFPQLSDPMEVLDWVTK